MKSYFLALFNGVSLRKIVNIYYRCHDDDDVL